MNLMVFSQRYSATATCIWRGINRYNHNFVRENILCPETFETPILEDKGGVRPVKNFFANFSSPELRMHNGVIRAETRMCASKNWRLFHYFEEEMPILDYIPRAKQSIKLPFLRQFDRIFLKMRNLTFFKSSFSTLNNFLKCIIHEIGP